MTTTTKPTKVLIRAFEYEIRDAEQEVRAICDMLGAILKEWNNLKIGVGISLDELFSLHDVAVFVRKKIAESMPEQTTLGGHLIDKTKAAELVSLPDTSKLQAAVTEVRDRFNSKQQAIIEDRRKNNPSRWSQFNCTYTKLYLIDNGLVIVNQQVLDAELDKAFRDYAKTTEQKVLHQAMQDFCEVLNGQINPTIKTYKGPKRSLQVISDALNYKKSDDPRFAHSYLTRPEIKFPIDDLLLWDFEAKCWKINFEYILSV